MYVYLRTPNIEKFIISKYMNKVYFWNLRLTYKFLARTNSPRCPDYTNVTYKEINILTLQVPINALR